MRAAHGVLTGIRVLDFGRFIAAPYCAMILADMGAEVIRVERPGGEIDRTIGLRAVNGENFMFPGLARNKKGITLDVQAPDSAAVLSGLVSRSDVLLHNFTRGAARVMKLSYEDVRISNAKIIYAGITCFGWAGPREEESGFDPIAQVASGAAALSGFDGEPPLRCGVPWVDYSTGLSAALGILLALRHRDATGEGQEVDCALLQTAVSFTAPMVAEAVVGGRERPRLGNRAPYLGPSDLYACQDGYVYLSAATDTMWRSLARLIGRPDLLDDGRYRGGEQLFANRGDIDPAVAAWMATRSVGEALAALQRARIPCCEYRGTGQVPEDPQVEACRMLEYVDLEVPGLEHVPVSGVPVRLSRSGGTVVSRPPRVGEHNAEIYGRLLGYGEDRIDALRNTGVI